MSQNDYKGKKCTGCAYCIHANHTEMKCYPESDDCKSEYDLTEADFHMKAYCDFFHSK